MIDKRSDLSRYLIHLTRDYDDMSALENLLNILQRKIIEARNYHCLFSPKLRKMDISSQLQNYFKTVCFTETPLNQIKNLVSDIPKRNIKLKPYGIVFLRDQLIDKGANPAIYLNAKGTNLRGYLIQQFDDQFKKIKTLRKLKRVRKRADWILRQIDYFDQFTPLPPERRYVSGETHLYLGRQYRLKIVEGAKEQVKLKGRYFWVHTKVVSAFERVKGLMLSWYKDHAKAMLKKRLENCYSMVRRVGIPFPEVHYRRMQKRWGSCTPSGKVMLNTELAKAPVHCIDYVIVHELCHLKVSQHGAEFYKLLSKLMPDWEKRKERLEKVVL